MLARRRIAPFLRLVLWSKSRSPKLDLPNSLQRKSKRQSRRVPRQYTTTHMSAKAYERFGKRVFDVFAVVICLPILIPMLASLSIMVRLKLGTPVFFQQSRPGLRGKLFSILKFRSMTNQHGEDGQLLADELRLTRFGRLLRRTSLDELPQFLNVLRGDMSLVGPRPLLPKYLPLYTSEQACRHAVRPGVTGWAQVNGRNSSSWEDRLALDVWYVRNLSFALDCKVLWLTLIRVFSRNGVTPPDRETMPEFTGSRASVESEACHLASPK